MKKPKKIIKILINSFSTTKHPLITPKKIQKKKKRIMLYFCWHGYREKNTFIELI